MALPFVSPSCKDQRVKANAERRHCARVGIGDVVQREHVHATRKAAIPGWIKALSNAISSGSAPGATSARGRRVAIFLLGTGTRIDMPSDSLSISFCMAAGSAKRVAELAACAKGGPGIPAPCRRDRTECRHMRTGEGVGLGNQSPTLPAARG